MPVMIHRALKKVLLQTMAGSGSQPGARVKLLEDRHHLLQKLQGEGLGQETLAAQLSHHVERIHSDLARPELVSSVCSPAARTHCSAGPAKLPPRAPRVSWCGAVWVS